MNVILLRESEIRGCVSLDQDAFDAVAAGFTRLSQGKASLPPIMRINVEEYNGEVDVKSAYIHGLERFAIKIASGFLDNHKLGLPTGSGMMLVMSARTGFLDAVLLDNGYLTDVRTGIAGSIAANYLAPRLIQTAGVIGSGAQARWQIRGLKLVREFQELLVFGIDQQGVERYVVEMGNELGIPVRIAEDPQEVVEGSGFVVTTTPSRAPIIKADWLHPNLHITSMGSDAEHKQELDVQVFARADRIACDRKSQCFRLGELHHASQAGVISESDEITELGELTSGAQPGRQNEEQITVCDLTGVGVQDTAIALLAYQRALERDYGLSIEV